MTAFAPEMVQRMWQLGAVDWDQAYRILSYSFVNTSFTHALFVVVFTLALGNMIAREFRPGRSSRCSWVRPSGVPWSIRRRYPSCRAGWDR
ncbi:hypothetical protein ACFSYD_13190 [Paracoccus aerius]